MEGTKIRQAADEARAVANLLARHRLSVSDEADLQAAIHGILLADGRPARREAWLGSDRPDFLLGDVAIEVKVKGTNVEVLRQLHRYAAHEEVLAILLVTTRAAHRTIPREACGKPILVQWVGLERL